jgi:hypothetical protein
MRVRCWRNALLVLLLVAAPATVRGFDGSSPQWTRTDPPINLRHIAHGEINRRGRAVGYHHRPEGVDPPDARVVAIVRPAGPSGVYRARVALRDRATGEWLDKTAPSTFFPDPLRQDEVVAAILAAFRAAPPRGDGRFTGPSGRGFAVEGWYQSGRINTAYPLMP